MRVQDAKERVPQKIPSSLGVPLTDASPSMNETSKRAGLSAEGGRMWFLIIFCPFLNGLGPVRDNTRNEK